MELDRVLESPNFINKNPMIKRRSLGIGLVNPTSSRPFLESCGMFSQLRV